MGDLRQAYADVMLTASLEAELHAACSGSERETRKTYFMKVCDDAPPMSITVNNVPV